MHVLCDGNGAFNKVVGADAGREEEGAADAKDYFVSELVNCRDDGEGLQVEGDFEAGGVQYGKER